jgi:hypothetical protein
MAPNQPIKLTVPPQGHRSIIGGPIRAAVPQLIGKALGGLKDAARWDSALDCVITTW